MDDSEATPLRLEVGQGDGGMWCATSPGLRGLFVSGETEAEVREAAPLVAVELYRMSEARLTAENAALRRAVSEQTEAIADMEEAEEALRIKLAAFIQESRQLVANVTAARDAAEADAERLREVGGALDWLATRRTLSVSFGYDNEECAGRWVVYDEHGNRSDREWTLIGEGETPAEALAAARAALATSAQEGRS